MTEHAILSPSGANRWIACPPSARFEEQIPGEQSKYAGEGSLAHELAATLLVEAKDELQGKANEDLFSDSLMQIKRSPFYTPIMHSHCEDYTTYVIGLLAKEDVLQIEQRYDLSKYIPLSFGTADAVIIGPDRLHIIDLKYGAGLPVSAIYNTQLMCYALGVVEEAGRLGYHPEKITFHIFQPRFGGASTWGLLTEELTNWAETVISTKAKLAIAGAGEFAAGSHCQFCRAKLRCREYYKRFSSIKKIHDAREITDEERAEIIKHASSLSAWMDQVKKESVERAKEGLYVKGFKLSVTQGKREFRGEYDVVEELLTLGFDHTHLYDTRLKSVKEIENLLGKDRFEEVLGNQVISTEQYRLVIDDSPDSESRAIFGED